MFAHKVEIDINRPVPEVFAFITNPANHARWDSTSLVMEPQSHGAWHSGMKLREVRKLGGRETEVWSQVADLEPNRRMTIKSLTGPEWLGEWYFEPVGNRTHLRFEAQMKTHGLMRLMEPMIAKSLKRDIDANFARLKTVLEGAE